jgi:hypothetical protein
MIQAISVAADGTVTGTGNDENRLRLPELARMLVCFDRVVRIIENPDHSIM